MHLKQVKNLHENASFLYEIIKNYSGEGQHHTPYLFVPLYSEFLDLPLV